MAKVQRGVGLRKRKIRLFGGKRYELSGQSLSKSKHDLEEWADRQRRVNNRNVRIVREGGGWEAYISVDRRR